MAKPTGFLEFTREEPPQAAGGGAGQRLSRGRGALPEERIDRRRRPGAWTAAFRSATPSAAPGEPDPGLERHGLPGALAEGPGSAPPTSNFPGDHGARLPGALRGRLHPGDQPAAVSIRQIELQIVERGWQEGWIRPGAAGAQDREAVAVVGSGPRRAAAAQQLARTRPRRHGVREGGPHRRHAALRHPGFQAREMGHRPPPRADAGGGGGLRDGRERRRGHLRRRTCAAASTPSCSPRAPASPGISQVPGRELEGIHFAMDFLTQQNRVIAGDAIPPRRAHLGGGETRRGHRRRRHGLRLHRHQPPPGRGHDHADRAPSEAAGRPPPDEPLAHLAAHPAHLLVPRGRLRADVERPTKEVRRGRRAGCGGCAA